MSSSCHRAASHSEHKSFVPLFLNDTLLTTSNLLPTVFYCILIIFLLLKYKRQRNETLAHKLEIKLKQNNLKQMPSPAQLPIIGHLHLMRNYSKNPWDGFNAVREQYGDIVSLKMGVQSMVLISSVDYMNEVLIKKGHIFSDRPYFPRHNIVFGGDKENSLALCNWSNTHRARRKFCKRGVVPNKLSARNQLLEKIISGQMKIFVDSINAKLNAKTNSRSSLSTPSFQVDKTFHETSYLNMTKHDLLFLTGDIFMKFLCNEECSHTDEKYEKFNIGCDFIFYDINQCYLLDFMPYLTSFGVGYFYLKQLKSITDYCRYYIDDNIFEPRRLKHIQNGIVEQPVPCLNNLLDYNREHSSSMEGEIESDINKTEQRNQHNNSFSLDEEDYLDSIIKEQISGATTMTLEDYKVGFADLLAGHAAVTNILMRVLGHLSLEEEIQDMIYNEAKRAQLSSLDQTPPLPVAEASLQEALRLASSPIVPHVAREDTSIGAYYVPAGSAVLFNCYNVNLTPDLWTKPREFNPKRFLQSSSNSLGEVSYKLNLPKYFMPFSVGQRQCLGYRMVESISIVAVSSLCLNFKIRPRNEQLVRKLLEPRGTVALNPLEECFEFEIFQR